MKPDFNLDDLSKKQPYRVPEDYFDKLPNRIMQRVTTEPETAWSWWPNLSAPLRMALASLLLIVTFAGVFFLAGKTTTGPDSSQLASVTEQEIMDYLLASGRLETSDLAELTAASQDFTHYFIPAADADIETHLENRDLEDFYL